MHRGTWRRCRAFFLPGWNKFNNPSVDPCRPRTMHECAASVSCARANSAYSRVGELGRGLHGPKDENPEASPPPECRCVQLANGARLETPDGSTILNGSQGVGKTSCPHQDDGHASRQRRGAQTDSRAMDHAARY